MHTYHSIQDRVGFFLFLPHIRSFIHSFMFSFFFTHRPCTHDAVLSIVSCVYHKNHTQHNFGNVFFFSQSCVSASWSTDKFSSVSVVWMFQRKGSATTTIYSNLNIFFHFSSTDYFAFFQKIKLNLFFI